MKIAMYGGSFDPVHIGHEQAIEYLAKRFDKVVVLLAKLSPFKTTMHANDMQRLCMLKSVVKYDNVYIDTQELDRACPSYTVYSVLSLRAQYKDAELWLCIGYDNLSNLHEWYDWKTIESNCRLLIFGRSYYPTEMMVQSVDIDDATRQHVLNVVKKMESEIPIQSIDIKYTMADVRLPSVSSSLARISTSMRCGHWCLSEPVRDIIGHQLYQEYSQLSSSLELEMFGLTVGRIAHIRRATLNGVALAQVCGVDKHKVAIAMLLHDIAKSLELQRLEELSKYYGWDVDIDRISQLPKPIQHSLAGRYIAKSYFGIIDAQILDAIEYHTTARPNMTSLDMVVYLADATECGRLYKTYSRGLSCDNKLLRIIQLAYSGMLERAMSCALIDSVDSLNERKVPIYYLTQQALDCYAKYNET
ncbi:MAG: bis(5'-nucleosyl)-tetraphosphatase (symmetrical) YqeK [Clostridiales bacterium]|jgi:nicotinate-nucleotide adenylyltransferase|nr:bis(5'-nucleosyl)-tetraphosphatase (symmetrical) YqeK [Clostridiales bacterium]